MRVRVVEVVELAPVREEQHPDARGAGGREQELVLLGPREAHRVHLAAPGEGAVLERLDAPVDGAAEPGAVEARRGRAPASSGRSPGRKSSQVRKVEKRSPSRARSSWSSEVPLRAWPTTKTGSRTASAGSPERARDRGPCRARGRRRRGESRAARHDEQHEARRRAADRRRRGGTCGDRCAGRRARGESTAPRRPRGSARKTVWARCGSAAARGAATPSRPRPARQPTPPLTTAKVALVAAARKPDSTAPSWFEAAMKIMFTAETRPRSASGVESWIAVWRITTLTWSAMPTTHVGRDREREPAREAEDDRREAVDADRREERAAAALDRAAAARGAATSRARPPRGTRRGCRSRRGPTSRISFA